MKIINGTKAQLNVLRNFYPDKQRISSYLALIPADEYYFWSRRFTLLLDALSAFIYPISLKQATKLPIIQCVAKLVGVNSDGFLIPKVFKFGSLPEGTFKNFGLSSQVAPLLDSIASSLEFPIMPFPRKVFNSTSLGFLAWDCSHLSNLHGKNLTQFIPCANVSRLDEVQIIHDVDIRYENRTYTSLLPTYNYYENTKFQRLLTRFEELDLLTLPLKSPFSNLKKLIGFTDPSWAEVKPLEFFLDEDPDRLANYVLIRIDDGKIVTWNEVMNTPKLRLEIEMSDYWLWQEACVTDPSLENINLYWEFGMDYPWLIDKRDNTSIPVFIVS